MNPFQPMTYPGCANTKPARRSPEGHENYIRSTAKDYDMDYEDVKYIYEWSTDVSFHYELEEFIKERAKK